MREVSESYRTGAEKEIRDVGVKILTNDDEAKTIPSDQILSINIQRSVSGGSFSIGNAPSDRLNAVIIGTEKLPKKTRITVYVNFDGSDWERLGRFYVDSCTRNGQRITVTAYDALSLAEKPVKFGGSSDKGLEKLNFPCTMQAMLDYIVALRGMTCEFECQPFMVYEKPMKSETEFYTARELFGMIAGCHGCNAKMNSEGKLIFREFGEVVANLTSGNVLDQTIDDGEPFTVRGVLFNRTDQVSFYVDDVPGSSYDEEADGIVICNNPLATVQIAEYVWNRIGNLSYYGGSLKIRGAGILECGDVASVGNLKYPTDSASYPFCITDISYSISREDGFTEMLSSEVTRKSSTSGSGFDSSPSYTAGKGIEIVGNTINLKVAQNGDADYAGTGKYLGGVYVGSGLNIDVDGKLFLRSATLSTKGGLTIGNGLRTNTEGKCSVNLGKGMRFDPFTEYEYQHKLYYGNSISPNAGDGLKIDQSEEEEDPDYGKLHLNLGKGLEFGVREYEKKKNSVGSDTEEDDPTRYTSAVQIKIGEGLRFGENGEVIAEGGAYKAGENISISEDGTISAQVKEYKAGKNITISDNGTISADVKEYTAGENITISANGEISSTGGGAELSAGGGITIKTDEETGTQTVSAAVGEGVRIENGKICTVPNIQNAVFISEKDAKYLLHNFTEIEYNRGSQIGYAGPGNQIVVQGFLAYSDAFIKNESSSTSTIHFPYTWDKAFSTYTEISGDFYFATSSSGSSFARHFNKVYLGINLVNPTRTIYQTVGVPVDENPYIFGSFENYNSWSGVGLFFEWDSISPPGTTIRGVTFDNGVMIGALRYLRDDGKRYYSEKVGSYWCIPFASIDEYNAAVGLTYEPLTLTQVVDNPTVVSSKDIGKE